MRHNRHEYKRYNTLIEIHNSKKKKKKKKKKRRKKCINKNKRFFTSFLFASFGRVCVVSSNRDTIRINKIALIESTN